MTGAWWRRGLTFAELRTVLLMVAVAATACLMPAQADTYWHLRAGADFFATGQVPLVDSYSHTVRGLPWPNHEWLWQALSYGIHRTGGMPALVTVGSTFATLAAVVATRLMRARPSVNFVLALVGIPLASVVWALRPQIASMLFLVLLVRLIVDERFWLIPLLFVVWANLHGAVALGGVVMVTATGVACFEDRRLFGRFGRLAIVTVLSGALTAATPMGPSLWRFIGESMARSRQNRVMEWLPSYPKGPVEIAFWLAAVALVVVVVLRWRRLESWSDRVLVAVALILLPLAARAVRNISPFLLLWMPAMSRLIGPDVRLPRLPGRWGRLDLRSQSDKPDKPDNLGNPGNLEAAESGEHPRLNLAIAGLAVAGAIAAVVTCWTIPIERLGWRPIAPGAVSAVSACPGPLYNRYSEGGYLIWFAPDVPVFVDSRQDPYPAELLAAHVAAEKSGDYRELFTRYRIGCAALPPTSPVAKRLGTDGWTETYSDDAWVVLNPPGARN